MMERLTRRERQVYETLEECEGVERVHIAERLGMTENCLSALLSKARAKLGVSAKRGRPATRPVFRRRVPDLGTTAQAQSTLRNARGVDGAAAIPRSENDGKGPAGPDRNAAQMAHQYNVERPAMPPAVPMKADVVTSPGEQRAPVRGEP